MAFRWRTDNGPLMVIFGFSVHQEGGGRGGGGGWRGGGHPDLPEKSQKYSFFSNTGPDPHSMLGHHWHASETQWRSAGGPIMARLWWYLDSPSPHKRLVKVGPPLIKLSTFWVRACYPLIWKWLKAKTSPKCWPKYINLKLRPKIKKKQPVFRVTQPYVNYWWNLYFFRFLENISFYAFRKAKCLSKCIKLYFFPEKKICVPSLSKIFRLVSRNTLIVFICLSCRLWL